MRFVPKVRRLQAGFTMIEVMVAVVLLNLLVAGVVKLFIGQNAMVEDLEGWAEGEPTWYVGPVADPLARQFGMSAIMSDDPLPAPRPQETDTPYRLEVESMQRLPESDALLVVLRQVEQKEGEGKDAKEEKKGKKDQEGRH